MADLDDDIPEVAGYSQDDDDLPPVAGFDEDLPEVAESTGAAARAPTMGTGNPHLDNLLKWYSGMSEAATLNHAGEVGEAGSRVGTALADMLQPSRARDGMEPEYAGRRGVDPNEIVDRSLESPVGKLGYATGVVAPAIASGGAAAAPLATRAGVGAAQGALAAGGDSGHDPLAMLTGGATGGLMAGLGDVAARSASKVSNAMRSVPPARVATAAPAAATAPAVEATAQSADDILAQLAAKHGTANRYQPYLGGSSEAVTEGLGAAGVASAAKVPLPKVAAPALSRGEQALAELAASKPSIAQSFMEPTRFAKNAVGRGAVSAAMNAERVAPALRATGTAAAPLFGSMASRPSKASAQADVAYGTAPTMAWAVESVLTSGDTGLDPKDEQQLTEAVMSGDEDRMIAANFSLSQRSPAYAARLRRELESLQEE